MAVATSTKGRNLAPYRRLRDGDLEVLLTPELTRLAPTIEISTRRFVTKGFRVSFPGAWENCQI